MESRVGAAGSSSTVVAVVSDASQREKPVPTLVLIRDTSEEYAPG